MKNRKSQNSEWQQKVAFFVINFPHRFVMEHALNFREMEKYKSGITLPEEHTLWKIAFLNSFREIPVKDIHDAFHF